MLYPTALNVLITNWCNAKCDHCCMNAGPTRHDKLDFAAIKKAISELHAQHTLRLVVFAGGEPTIERATLSQSIRFCSELGIRTRLVTNAFWAKSAAAAFRYLKELRADGLVEINVSCDDYHLPYVPVGNVKNVWQAAKELDFETVVIANGSGPNNLINPGYLAEILGEGSPSKLTYKGMHLMSEFEAGSDSYFAISQTTFQRLERAAQALPENAFVPIASQAPLNGNCPHVLTNAALSPKGHLLACCGFEVDGNAVLDIGGVENESLPQLVEDACNNDILAALAYLGPYFLMKTALRLTGQNIEDHKFGALCEVCSALTKAPAHLRALKANPNEWIPLLRKRQYQDRMQAAA